MKTKATRKRPPKQKSVERIPAPTKLAWSEVEAFYIQAENRPSLRAVAKKYGVCLATVFKHAHGEGWLRKRREFWQKIDATVAAEVRHRLVAKRVERTIALDEVIDALLTRLNRRGQISKMGTEDLRRLMTMQQEGM